MSWVIIFSYQQSLHERNFHPEDLATEECFQVWGRGGWSLPDEAESTLAQCQQTGWSPVGQEYLSRSVFFRWNLSKYLHTSAPWRWGMEMKGMHQTPSPISQYSNSTFWTKLKLYQIARIERGNEADLGFKSKNRGILLHLQPFHCNISVSPLYLENWYRVVYIRTMKFQGTYLAHTILHQALVSGVFGEHGSFPTLL